MKTAISIPDDLYQRAEQLARRTGRTRSSLYTEALREFVTLHAPPTRRAGTWSDRMQLLEPEGDAIGSDPDIVVLFEHTEAPED